MISEQHRQLLIKLAERIKGAPLTERESTLLVLSYERGTGAEREKCVQAISESLNVNFSAVVKRASHDDTDRIIQDILNEIKSKPR